MKYLLRKIIYLLSGVLLYRWHNLKPGLYIFNYHRVGDSSATEYDGNVFSCNEGNLTKHLITIKARFEIIRISRLVDIIENEEVIKKPLAMITFDDGYIDNYDIAFPILKKLDIKATFYLPTSYVGTNNIPWWDEIAWMLKRSTVSQIKLVGWKESVTINYGNIDKSVRLVLNNIKKDTTVSMRKKLEQIRKVLKLECPNFAKSPLFINWDQAREMHAAGMTLGSHTHSHQILSHLSKDRQLLELTKSREILEMELNTTITSFAYPVGKAKSYTALTLSLCEKAGYKVAFSFINGFNSPSNLKRFELLRMPVDGNGDSTDIKLLTISAMQDSR